MPAGHSAPRALRKATNRGMEHVIAAIVVAGLGIAITVAISVLRARDTPRDEAERESMRVPGEPHAARSDHAPDDRLSPVTLQPGVLTGDELDWIAQAADGLRAPLAVLRSYADYLRQHLSAGSDADLAGVSARLMSEIEHIEGMIEAWSVTAQINEGDRDPTARPADILALISRLCARHEEWRDPSCEVADGPPLWALVDGALIEQALAVLVRNARRAAPHGVVEIIARAMGQGERARICLAVAARRAITRGPQPHLWEASALGLASVLAAALGGWLDLQDRAGGGAATLIWLPGQLILPVPRPRSAFETAPRQAALRPAG